MFKLAQSKEIVFSFFLFLIVVGDFAVAFEEPRYSIISKLEKIELRQYQDYLVAETTVVGNRDEAGSTGFKILAGYIFGGNKGNDNISMTAPVIQLQIDPTQIKSTTLVQSADTSEKQNWIVQFMMPSKYQLETLPKPKDSRILFKHIQPRKIAAITYSGRWTESNYHEHLDILIKEMQKAKLTAKGLPLWARYNSPFTPWFLRKNEIFMEFE